MRTSIAILAACLLSLSLGCGAPNNGPSTRDEVKTLRTQQSELLQQIKLTEDKNAQLEDQVRILSGLSSEVRLEYLQSLEAVKIGRLTNLYDKDKDGKNEKLIVYLQPTDGQGDIVKAPGAVDVQLWDLSKQPNEALVGEWHIEAAELNKLWFATMLTTNYRLLFDISDKVDTIEQPLTLKVKFIDHLSGRVFKEEKVIRKR